jgi:hypothetical protein
MLLNIRKPGDTVSLKMSSGEEIIGTYKSDDATSYVIDKPVSLTAGPNGKPALVPYLMTVKPQNARDIAFNKSLVVCVANTEKELATQYSSAMSGIVAAPAGLRLDA